MMFPIPGRRGLAFGGDYNPEQWPEHTWPADIELMRAAGVTMVTVGVFSWAMLEPAPGRYTFGWLDRVMDLLAAGGIAVDLATATATPPPWFSRAHPDSLPVDADGRRLSWGSRQAYCPSSPSYRTAASALVERLATRYAGHPALAMWHVNNEYGCHVARCWCDVSAAAFRGWLERRYGDLGTLNEAWGTAFWSQRYSDWREILPPRHTPSFPNPTQQLDFFRFSSDELLACYLAERDLLRRLAPSTPVTTNLMAGLAWEVDYWSWAGEMDLIATDHYPVAARTHDTGVQIALAGDLARSLAGGRPWLLMEHATSAVNWQPRNLAKVPGQLRRESLSHLARGADALLYFQWRASPAGAEQWHSGMLPHAGPETKVFREVSALGGELAALGEISGSVLRADTAILLDWSSLWAQEHACQPSIDLRPVGLFEAWHAALRTAGIVVDFAHPEADLSRYRLLLAPALYLVSDAGAANLAAWVATGGTAVIGPFSGVVNEHAQVRLGGYPGAFRDLLGVWVEEHFPLLDGESVALTDGSTGRLWTELAESRGAEVLAAYADGPLAGRPAHTRHRHGEGTAHYLTTHPVGADLEAFLDRIARSAGVLPTLAGPVPGVDATTRRSADGVRWTFLANNGPDAVQVELTGQVLTGAERTPGGVLVPGGGFAVVRQEG